MVENVAITLIGRVHYWHFRSHGHGHWHIQTKDDLIFIILAFFSTGILCVGLPIALLELFTENRNRLFSKTAILITLLLSFASLAYLLMKLWNFYQGLPG